MKMLELQPPIYIRGRRGSGSGKLITSTKIICLGLSNPEDLLALLALCEVYVFVSCTSCKVKFT